MRFGRGPWMYTIAKMTNQLAGIFFCFFSAIICEKYWIISMFWMLADVQAGKKLKLRVLFVMSTYYRVYLNMLKIKKCYLRLLSEGLSNVKNNLEWKLRHFKSSHSFKWIHGAFLTMQNLPSFLSFQEAWPILLYKKQKIISVS